MFHSPRRLCLSKDICDHQPIVHNSEFVRRVNMTSTPLHSHLRFMERKKENLCFHSSLVSIAKMTTSRFCRCPSRKTESNGSIFFQGADQGRRAAELKCECASVLFWRLLKVKPCLYLLKTRKVATSCQNGFIMLDIYLCISLSTSCVVFSLVS